MADFAGLQKPDRRRPEPLWHQAEMALRQLIEGGEWSAGSQLPNEDRLGEMLGISRITIDDKLKGLNLPVSSGVLVDTVQTGSPAAKAGIKLDVVREPNDGYWSNVWLKKPFAVASYGQRATPDMMFSTFYRDGAPWNTTQWHDDKFQSLLLAAKAELDDKKRAQMYAEMQQLCRDDGGTIVPFFFSLVDARSSKVKHGPKLGSDWQMEGGRAYQRWWFEG